MVFLQSDGASYDVVIYLSTQDFEENGVRVCRSCAERWFLPSDLLLWMDGL